MVPVFESAVKKQFLNNLDTAATLKIFTDGLATLNLQKLSQTATTLKPLVGQHA